MPTASPGNSRSPAFRRGPCPHASPDSAKPARDHAGLRPANRPLRWILAGLGLLCFAIGLLGAFVPGLPTTIFWILAVAFAGKSCPWVRRWVYQRGRTGHYVEMVVERRGLPPAGKAAALLGINLGIGVSLAVFAALGRLSPWVALAMIAAAAFASGVVIFGLRTLDPADPLPSTDQISSPPR